MSRDTEDDAAAFDRRRLLAALAAAGIPFSAGCETGPGDETATAGTTESATPTGTRTPTPTPTPTATDRAYGASGPSYTLASPDGTLELAVGLSDGTPYYAVDHDGRRLVERSGLGLRLREAPALSDGFDVAGTNRERVDETWEPVWGATDEIRDRHRELTLDLEKRDGSGRLTLVFRAYDDGVAFRYVLPEQERIDDFAIASERTGFRFADDYTAWWIPGDYDSYEHLYEETTLGGINQANTPITMRAADDTYLSVHEAALIDYAGMTLYWTGGEGEFQSELVPLPDGSKVKASTPHRSPWRTFIVGRDPGDLIESNLILNLNEPPAFDDTDWIEPQTYMGIWWAIHVGIWTWTPGPNLGATTEHAKEYIDFAAEHDVPALLVEGWNQGWKAGGDWDSQDFTTPNEQFDLEAVVEYGAERGVDLIAHNETGGGVENYERQLEAAFSLYEDLGIPAVKTGYAGDIELHRHHDQRMVNHYHRVAEVAAEHGLMINAHESIKPTGVRRTYPNFVTRECVRGMEYNAWSDGNPPGHTVTIPFTRMLGGPVDYTPGIFEIDFEDRGGPGSFDDEVPGNQRVHTTRAHQLALYPILFSGLQMAADLPEHYSEAPDEFAFVEHVPADWDETRVVNGAIGKYVTIARRNGEEWYVGSATNGTARELDVPLSFLGDGPYTATMYADGPDADLSENPTDVTIAERRVTAADTITASMVAGGGQAIRLTPAE